MAAVEGHAARDVRRRPDLQAQDRGVLGGLAHARARRGGPPRPFRRRDLARGAPGRADLLQRRARRLVVHGGIRELEGVVGAHGADTGARRPCARPGPEPRSRDACSTRSARAKGARRQGRSFRRAGSCTGPHSTSCISRRCTRRSCGASATSTDAASGPTSSRTPRSSTGGGSTPTRGSGRRGGRSRRWSRRGRSSPTSIPSSRRPARSLRPTTG